MAQNRGPTFIGTPACSIAWFPFYVAIKRGFPQKEGINLQSLVLDSRLIVPSIPRKEIPLRP